MTDNRSSSKAPDHDPVAFARPASWYVDPVTRDARANFCWHEHRLAVLLCAPEGVPPDVRRADLERGPLLRAQGYHVLRFSEADVYHRPDEMMARVSEFLPSNGE